jgi:hypothetical protein
VGGHGLAAWITLTCTAALTDVAMVLARAPKRRVETVSSASDAEGLAAITIVVRQLPPSDDCRMRVSFESRNGTCAPGLPSESAAMQLPSADSDLLMFLASVSVSPLAPVFFVFSEPARSHRLSTPFLTDPSRQVVTRCTRTLRTSTSGVIMPTRPRPSFQHLARHSVRAAAAAAVAAYVCRCLSLLILTPRVSGSSPRSCAWPRPRASRRRCAASRRSSPR